MNAVIESLYLEVIREYRLTGAPWRTTESVEICEAVAQKLRDDGYEVILEANQNAFFRVFTLR